MYSQWIYTAFVQLRKQYYKLKTRDSIDRYTKIEMNARNYKTFRKFCDSINEYNSFFDDYERCICIQDSFDNLLELSQKNTLKYYIN